VFIDFVLASLLVAKFGGMSVIRRMYPDSMLECHRERVLVYDGVEVMSKKWVEFLLIGGLFRGGNPGLSVHLFHLN